MHCSCPYLPRVLHNLPLSQVRYVKRWLEMDLAVVGQPWRLLMATWRDVLWISRNYPLFLLLPEDENPWCPVSCDTLQVCTTVLPQQHPPSWLIPPQPTWEYLHFWHLMLAGLGRDGTILSRWLRINCCTSAGSESRCLLPKVTVVWTTTEGPISGDSEIKKRGAFERLLINTCLPASWQLCF